MISWRAISNLVELGFERECLSLPGKTYNSDPKMAVVRVKDNNGSYTFVFENTTSRFGEKLDLEPWREERLMPFISAAAHLDKDAMILVLNQLPELAREQEQVHRRIEEITGPIRSSGSRWIARTTVVNYGNSALIIWPEAYIRVVDKSIRAKFKLRCYLAQEKVSANSTDAVDLQGPVVLSPNDSVNIWVISRESQEEMQNGGVLRAHYQTGLCKSHIGLYVTSRGIPWKSIVRSTTARFQDKDEAELAIVDG